MRAQATEDAGPVPSSQTASIQQIDPVPRVSIQAVLRNGGGCRRRAQAAIGDRRMNKAHVKQNMGGAAAAAVEAYRNSPTPNVIVLEATANRDPLVEQLDELSQYCDAGTKVIIIGKVNDIVLYRQPQSRAGSANIWSGRLALSSSLARSRTCFAVPTPSRSAVSFPSSAPRAASARRPSPTISPGNSRAPSTWRPSSPISIWASAPRASISTRIRLKAWRKAVFDPSACRCDAGRSPAVRCGDNLNLLAAPAMLDRLYDFGETSFDSLIDTVRASTPWIVLDIPHAWNAWTRRLLVGADEVIVVAAPDLANLRNAKNIMDNIRNARPHDHPPRDWF